MTTSDSRPLDGESLRLFLAAQYHAWEAVRGAGQPWTAHAALDVAIRCGSAVELLAKALLFELDPRLVARSAHHHLLDLALEAQHQQPATPVQPGQSTIDATTAVQLVRRLDVSLAGPAREVHAVLEARNAAVHLALAPDEERLQALITAMAAFTGAVLGVLGQDLPNYWGPYAGATMDRIDARAARVKAEAERLVEAARGHYQQLRGGLAPDAWQRVLKVLYERRATADLSAEVECPACAQDASVLWSAEAEVEYSDGEWNAVGYWALEGLRCPVCGLDLDGDELEALELADLPDVADLAAEDFLDDLREVD